MKAHIDISLLQRNAFDMACSIESRGVGRRGIGRSNSRIAGSYLTRDMDVSELYRVVLSDNAMG
jgi:hypothetical protein